MMNLEQAIELAREEVTERGEAFVYNPNGALGCFYAPLGEAGQVDQHAGPDDPRLKHGCLVGGILERAGMLTPSVARARASVETLATQQMISASEDAVRFLAGIQRSQDDGATALGALSAGLECMGMDPV